MLRAKSFHHYLRSGCCDLVNDSYQIFVPLAIAEATSQSTMPSDEGYVDVFERFQTFQHGFAVFFKVADPVCYATPAYFYSQMFDCGEAICAERSIESQQAIWGGKAEIGSCIEVVCRVVV